jgi:thiol-disulfide isomerase/thioredoxin
MKSLACLPICLCFLMNTAAFANGGEGIIFLPEESTFTQILEKAKAEKKIIFIDAYTTWCGPCKWMAKNVFTDPEIGAFFNQNFINAKFDMEKGEGINLRRRYGVNTYPTLLFIDGRGEVVHRLCGSKDKEKFLEEAKISLDNNKNLKSFVSKFDSGNRDISFLQDFLKFGSSVCMEMENVLNEYWPRLDKKLWATEANWNIFKNYVQDFESEQFQYLIGNYEGVEITKSRRNEVDEYVQKIMYFALLEPMNDGNKELLVSNKEKIGKINIASAKKALILAGLSEYDKTKDWLNYFRITESYIENFGFDKPERINEFSWTIYQNVDDKHLLAKAAKWMGDMVRDDANKEIVYMDTHASLLIKSGNVKEGEKVNKEAVALANSRGENYLAQREIRKLKAELYQELEKIDQQIEDATKAGKLGKVGDLQELRKNTITEHNKKVTKVEGKD